MIKKVLNKKILLMSLLLFLLPAGMAFAQTDFTGAYRVSSWTLSVDLDLTHQVDICIITSQGDTAMIFVYNEGQLNPQDPYTGVRHAIIMSNYISSSRTFRDVEYLGQGIIDQLTGRISRVGNRVTVEVLFDGYEFDKLELSPL